MMAPHTTPTRKELDNTLLTASRELTSASGHTEGFEGPVYWDMYYEGKKVEGNKTTVHFYGVRLNGHREVVMPNCEVEGERYYNVLIQRFPDEGKSVNLHHLFVARDGADVETAWERAVVINDKFGPEEAARWLIEEAASQFGLGLVPPESYRI